MDDKRFTHYIAISNGNTNNDSDQYKRRFFSTVRSLVKQNKITANNGKCENSTGNHSKAQRVAANSSNSQQATAKHSIVVIVRYAPVLIFINTG
ncbi:hypothetical protein, partial [Colwellia sp. MB02u-7]|uniref:hypothetical protein n=1 Tax=Colwellia sp. MB02u-7 TaxID=2759814 RepID=UPI0015F6E7FF